MVTWRVCIVVVTALLFVFFGDLLGLSMGKDRKMPVSRQSPTLRDDQPTIYLDSRSKSKFMYKLCISRFQCNNCATAFVVDL